MKPLSRIKRLDLRKIWKNEAYDFTPWLADNIIELGNALGMDLELEEIEAAFGDFSVDIHAIDLGTNRTVIIENQLTQTNHDHLGKLLTYAAGFDASIVIWIAGSIRDEHRQSLEWLNQRTDSNTDFFGVVVEVIQIDDSNPAFNFKIVISPNEWQKSKRLKTNTTVSEKRLSYKNYFQKLIDELRNNYKFSGAKIGQPQSWYAFPSGVSGVSINAVFSGNATTRIGLYIDLHDQDINKSLFDWLFQQREIIENACGFTLCWDRLDDKQACRIYIDRAGIIESSEEELEDIRKWHIEKLLIFKKVFSPMLKEWSNKA